MSRTSANNVCLPLRRPAKSTLTCGQHGNEVCTIRCQANTHPSHTQNEFVYRCGEETEYRWMNEHLNSTLPSCSGMIV